MAAQAPKRMPDLAGNFSTMAEKLGLSPAAWPSGVSLLAQAYEACRRCEAEEGCAEWLKAAPDSIQLPPDFCANAVEFTRAREAKSRG